MIQFPSDFNKQPGQINHPGSFHVMGRFYAEIYRMPALTKQAKMVDQVLLERIEGLREGALTLIDHFKKLRPVLLSRFDPHLLPLVQKVMDELLGDAEELKQILEQDITHLSDTSNHWENYAKSWGRWYRKWMDHNALKKKVLEKLFHHVTHLINKDIQLIQDYQAQALIHLDRESKEFKDVNRRLWEAMEEPLQELMALREVPGQSVSLEEASLWIATLSKKRELYVDCLLMKIDEVIEEEFSLEVLQSEFAVSEIDEEVDFMKRELYDIQADFARLNFDQGEEREFIKRRLEGLLDHIEQLQEKSLSKSLSKQAMTIKELVEYYLLELERE